MVKVGTLLVLVIASIILDASRAATDDVVMDDMVLSKQQYEEHFGESLGKNGFFVTPMQDYRWENKTVRIVFDKYVWPERQEEFKQITELISSKTCIKFVYNFNRQKNPNYLYIRNNTNFQCKTAIGYHGPGNQTLDWSRGKCNVLHLLLHSLGFFHMHQTPDRDKYVLINYTNVRDEAVKNFYKYTKKVLSYWNTEYDYLSLMGYHIYQFSKSKDKLVTMIPKDFSYVHTMGRQTTWSEGDIKRVNGMYNCPKQPPGPIWTNPDLSPV